MASSRKKNLGGSAQNAESKRSQLGFGITPKRLFMVLLSAALFFGMVTVNSRLQLSDYLMTDAKKIKCESSKPDNKTEPTEKETSELRLKLRHGHEYQSQAQENESGSLVEDDARDEEEDVYPFLLAKARENSAKDFNAYHNYGERGVAIGPVGGEFRHTLKALQNAKRTRNILPVNTDIKVSVVTVREHMDILRRSCKVRIAIHDLNFNESSPIIRSNEEHIDPNDVDEACRLLSNGTTLDHLIETWANPPYVNPAHAQGYDPNKIIDSYGASWQMSSLGGIFRAPYTQTLILDSDAYPCPGFEKLFDALHPYQNKMFSSPSFAPADLAIGLEQYAISKYTTVPQKYNPGKGRWPTDYGYFSERNTGVHIWNFEKEHTHVLAHFLVLVGEHLYNNVATKENPVVNDQEPFRVGLYLFRQMVPEFHEVNFPQHSSCRTYPNMDYAGLDGARNGMNPVQPNGDICRDCQCTPCLVYHDPGTFVTVNGKKGWEDDEKIVDGSNSLPPKVSHG